MKTIRFERQGSIGRIILANPPYNRLDLEFSHCLRDAVHEASSSDIRALVISSEGEDFSFGGEVREWPGKHIDWFRTFVAEVNASYRALEILRVPTVAGCKGCRLRRGIRTRSELRFSGCGRQRRIPVRRSHDWIYPD